MCRGLEQFLERKLYNEDVVEREHLVMADGEFIVCSCGKAGRAQRLYAMLCCAVLAEQM